VPAPRVVDKKLSKVALKIHAFLLQSKNSLTEAEIRHVIGDNPGTGAALRCVKNVVAAIFFESCKRRLLVSIGHVQKLGLGSRKYTKEVVGIEQLRSFTTGSLFLVLLRITSSTHAFMLFFRRSIPIFRARGQSI
jgi:hypothetical protein